MERFTLLTIAILIFASITKAQITKGSTFIGGQISVYTNKSTTDGATTQKEHSIFISPAVGTAIRQNLIAGIDLTYGYSSSYNGITKGNTFGGGFFLRKYFAISNRFNFFVQGRSGYSHSKLESAPSNYSYTYTSDVANLGLYPGVSFRLNRVLHIEAGLNNLALFSYSHSTNKQASSPNQSSNNFSFSTSTTGTNMAFALRFIIPKK